MIIRHSNAALVSQHPRPSQTDQEKQPTQKMTKYSISALCALALGSFGFASTIFAGDDDTAGKETKAIQETVKESCITGDIGVTIASEFINGRAIVLSDRGVAAQPYLDLYFKLYEGPGFINKITFDLGLWSDISSQTIHPNSSVRNWVEFDYTAGFTVTMAKNFSATLSYFEFDSPNGTFGTCRSANLNLAYDDTDALGAFALHPHFTILSELPAPGQAGIGPGGWYFEPGIAPSYTFAKGSAYPVTFSVPVKVGLANERTYDGEAFGYVAVGAQLAVPLAFVPSCYGAWSFTGGYTWYYVDQNLQNLQNSFIGDGKRNQNVFEGAIGLTF
jgi:hypothetical protein